MNKRPPAFSGFGELSPSAKLIYLIRLVLGSIVLVFLLFGVIAVIIALPSMREAQLVRENLHTSRTLWISYAFTDYDVDVFVDGLPEIEECGLRRDVTLIVREDQLVEVRDSETDESIPIGEAPCSYEAFTITNIFSTLWQTLDDFNPFEDYLGGVTFNPAFGFVRQYSYVECSSPTFFRLFNADFNHYEGCAADVFFQSSQFRWRDTLSEPSSQGGSD